MTTVGTSIFSGKEPDICTRSPRYGLNETATSVEIAYSELSAKENALLVQVISDNWDFINEQITKSFNGQKTIIKKLK